MYDIDITKKAIAAGIAIGESFAIGLADDGKIDLGESIDIGISLKELLPVIKARKELVAEIKDGYDDQELQDIQKYIENKFDIPQDEVEEKIEKGSKIILSIVEFLN